MKTIVFIALVALSAIMAVAAMLSFARAKESDLPFVPKFIGFFATIAAAVFGLLSWWVS